MTTPHPQFDPSNPRFQATRDDFGNMYFPDCLGLDEYEQGACEAYRQATAGAMIRVVIALLLSFGDSLQQLADRLGIDRTALSVAKNHGLLGSRPLAMLFANPLLWAKLLDRSPQICRLIAREAFIAAAEYTAAQIVRRDNPTRPLTQLDFELLCALVAYRHEDDPRKPLTEQDAAAIATRVLADPSLEVMPVWFGKQHRHETKCWMKQLRDTAFAHRHMTQLQTDWLNAFSYVWATLEGEGDESLWYGD